MVAERAWKGGPERVTAPYAKRRHYPDRTLSRAGPEEPCPKQAAPSAKAKHPGRPIVDKYREGKVKSTADSGVKENLKPCACKRSEPSDG